MLISNWRVVNRYFLFDIFNEDSGEPLELLGYQAYEYRYADIIAFRVKPEGVWERPATLKNRHHKEGVEISMGDAAMIMFEAKS